MTYSLYFTHFHNRKWLFVFSNQSKVLSKHILCSGKDLRICFSNNCQGLLIKVFPLSRREDLSVFRLIIIKVFPLSRRKDLSVFRLIIIIKVFPFSKGKNFMYFVWLLLLLLLFFSAAITTTVRDISFRNLMTSFRMTPNRKPPGHRKKLCMITELCPRTPKTLFHWTGQNHNRYQNSDWWDEFSD